MALTAAELRATYTVDESELDRSIDGIPGKIRGATAALAGAGLIIGGALAGGLMTGMENERVNDKLAAQLGAGQAYAADLGKIAGSLYANAYGDSLGTVNDAIRGVMQNGVLPEDATNAQIESITAKVLDLSAAFEADLGGATQAVGQLMRTGMAKDADEALDIIVRGMQQGADKSGDLLEVLNEYGGSFRIAGMDAAAATGLLVQGLGAGARSADEVADAIREIGIRITDSTAAEAIKTLGLNFEDVQARFARGGPEAAGALDQVMDALRGVEDPAKRAALAIELGGSMAENMGAAFTALDPSEAVGALGEVEGAADRMGKTLNDNASTNIESFKRQATQAFVDVLGGKVLPLVDDVASTLSTTFGPAVSAVTGFLGDNETAVKALGVSLGTAAGIIGTYVAVTRTVAGAKAAWAAAQVVLNTAMKANPIGLVVTAVAALAAGLVYAYQNSETFRDIVNGAFDLVKRGVGNAIGFMIDGFRMLLTVWLTIADGIVSGAATALGWVPGIGDKLQEANTAFDNMKDGILDTLDEAAQKAYGFGEDSGRNVAAGVASQSGPVYNAASSAVAGVAAAVSAANGGAYDSGYGVGGNAGQGVADGLAATQARVRAVARNVANEAAAALRAALEVRSPSRVTMYMGRMVGEGLAVGIRSSQSDVARAMGGLSGQVTGMAAPTIGVRAPAMAMAGGVSPGSAPSGGGPVGGGYDALLKADTINVIDGTPDELARKLSVEMITRGR